MTFTVTVPATDRSILTRAEAKAAVGDAASDADYAAIMTIAAQISDAIANYCNVASDGIQVPTLLRETIEETIRLQSCVPSICLSRRPVSSVTSVTFSGTSLAASAYEIERGSGILRRLDSSGHVTHWDRGVVVVTYVAGYAAVPQPVKMVAESLLRDSWSARSVDPLIRSESGDDGAGSISYYQSVSFSQGGLPPMMARALEPYVNHAI